MQLTNEQKKLIVDAMLERRANYDGTDEQFANSIGINYSVYSRLKTAENYDGLLRNDKWMDIGRELDVALKKHRWNVVKTDVYRMIEDEILFCKKYSKSRICVDSSDIGKTTTARALAREHKNCFYVDVSQCKEKAEFVRTLAKTVGVNPDDKLVNLKKKTKYMLKSLPEPIVILDEAGDMRYETFLTIKEYWNGTEGSCGWYMIGADALREWIERGKKYKKVGFYEIFNRFGANYSTIVPYDNKEKLAFYKKLITDVVKANIPDRAELNKVVTRCLVQDHYTGEISGLRRIESILILN